MQPSRASRPAGRRKPTKRMSEQIVSINRLAETADEAQMTPAAEPEIAAEPVVAAPRKPTGGVSLFGGIDPSAVKLKTTKAAGAAQRALPRPGTPPVVSTHPHPAQTSPEKTVQTTNQHTSPTKLTVTAEDTASAAKLVASIMASLASFGGDARTRMLAVAQNIATEFKISILFSNSNPSPLSTFKVARCFLDLFRVFRFECSSDCTRR